MCRGCECSYDYDYQLVIAQQKLTEEFQKNKALQDKLKRIEDHLTPLPQDIGRAILASEILSIMRDNGLGHLTREEIKDA